MPKIRKMDTDLIPSTRFKANFDQSRILPSLTNRIVGDRKLTLRWVGDRITVQIGIGRQIVSHGPRIVLHIPCDNRDVLTVGLALRKLTAKLLCDRKTLCHDQHARDVSIQSMHTKYLRSCILVLKPSLDSPHKRLALAILGGYGQQIRWLDHHTKIRIVMQKLDRSTTRRTLARRRLRNGHGDPVDLKQITRFNPQVAFATGSMIDRHTVVLDEPYAVTHRYPQHVPEHIGQLTSRWGDVGWDLDRFGGHRRLSSKHSSLECNLRLSTTRLA